MVGVRKVKGYALTHTYDILIQTSPADLQLTQLCAFSICELWPRPQILVLFPVTTVTPFHPFRCSALRRDHSQSREGAERSPVTSYRNQRSSNGTLQSLYV